jgi:hypothetical protein
MIQLGAAARQALSDSLIAARDGNTAGRNHGYEADGRAQHGKFMQADENLR